MVIAKHESRYPVEFIVQPFYLMKLSRVYLSCLKLHETMDFPSLREPFLRNSVFLTEPWPVNYKFNVSSID